MGGLLVVGEELAHAPIGGLLRLQPLQQSLARRGCDHEARGYDDLIRDLVALRWRLSKRAAQTSGVLTDQGRASIVGIGMPTYGAPPGEFP